MTDQRDKAGQVYYPPAPPTNPTTQPDYGTKVTVPDGFGSTKPATWIDGFAVPDKKDY